MAKTYIADKETLDSVKTDTGAILENLSSVGGVKSVQSGKIYCGASQSGNSSVGSSSACNGQYIDVTIKSVEPSKARVIVDHMAANTAKMSTPMGWLLNNTTLRIFYRLYTSSGSGSNNIVPIRWQVVEFN